ncbi:MAG: Sjogren's syndrome/scleroderma autoantigen 1 family protein [Methanolobus sp.]
MSNTDDDNIKKISRMLEIGGTMLAQHCANCGAPLFRYQGRVLCPVCEDIRDPRSPLQPENTPTSAPSPEEEVSYMEENKSPVAATPEENRPSVKPLAKKTLDSVPVQGSFSELESLLLSKMTSMAQDIQQETDPRRVSEYLDLIDRCMEIISKMRN